MVSRPILGKLYCKIQATVLMFGTEQEKIYRENKSHPLGCGMKETQRRRKMERRLFKRNIMDQLQKRVMK